MAGGKTRLRMGWRKRAFPALAGFLVLIAALIIQFFDAQPLQRFGFQLFDRFQNSAPRAYEDLGVRVIEIDEESLRRVGQWPWPRTKIAQMTARAAEYGAGVIAFDVVFSEPDRTSPEILFPELFDGSTPQGVDELFSQYLPHDEYMGRQFNAIDGVIMGYFLEADDNSIRPRRTSSFSVANQTSTIRDDGTIDYGDILNALPVYDAVTKSLDIIEDGASDSGFVSLATDRVYDVARSANIGMTRVAPLVAAIDGDLFPSMSLAMFRQIYVKYLVTDPALINNPERIGYYLETSARAQEGGRNQFAEEAIAIRIGDQYIPTTGSGAMWMHYAAGNRANDYNGRMIPAWKLLDPTVSEDELFDHFNPPILDENGQPMVDDFGEPIYRDTFVLIGASAQGLNDLVPTPVDARLPGVLIHAQALEQMLSGNFLTQPEWALGVRGFAILFGGLLLILVVPITGPLRSGLVAGGLVAALFYLSWWSYTDRLQLFDPVFAAGSLFAVYLVTSIVSFVLTEAEKSHIKGAFDRYLSPELVEKIADDPSQLRLGGEDRDLTILFSDIRAFSKTSEGMTPEELTNYINRYLTPMTDILLESNATVDKYIGDAIMSFWNAPLDDPDHHRNAARSALAMMEKLELMNVLVGRDDVEESQTLPVKTSIGIGLNSGLTSVGNMGSDQRFAYSVLGDTVNTAARLEGMTKQYGVGILIGQDLAEQLPEFATMELDWVKAVGKDEPLVIFALLGDEVRAADPHYSKLLDMQQEFLGAYRAQQFDDALIIAEEAALIGDNFGLRAHYDIMKGRIEEYRTNPPPEEWDGIYVLQNK